jgi:predicted DNA-binding transcriptional regulator AlpA
MDHDPLLDSDAIARLLGIKRNTFNAYVWRGHPRDCPVPPPDHTTTDRGHTRKLWRKSRIETWNKARTSRKDAS